MAVLVLAPSVSLFALEISARNILDLTNEARVGAGVPRLVPNEKLSLAAQTKAQDMANHGYFAHMSPLGLRHPDLLRSVRYAYLYSAENLAVHYARAEELEAGWMTSASHRANILDPRYTELGVGIATGEFEDTQTIFAVQMFGRPLDEPRAEQTAVQITRTSAPLIAAAAAQTPSPSPDRSPAPPASSAEPAAAAAPARPTIIRETRTAQPTIAAAPATSTAERPARIDEASVLVLPTSTGYAVRAQVEGATRVYAQSGAQAVALAATDATDTWQGVLAADAASGQEGGQVVLSAWAASGTLTSLPIAVMLPKAALAQVYTSYAPPPAAKIFGFISITRLDDAVRRVYVFFMILLGMALLLNVFVKFHIQRPGVILHTTAVLALIALLFFI